MQVDQQKTIAHKTEWNVWLLLHRNVRCKTDMW